MMLCTISAPDVIATFCLLSVLSNQSIGGNMIEFFFSRGTWFYIASWVHGPLVKESGLSVIILGLGVALIDEPFNPFRHEWVIPSNAWDDKE
jgi:hypothetical protein